MYWEYLFICYLLQLSVNPTIAQVCKHQSKNHPNSHLCDQKLHILHQNYDEIRKYCGKTTKNIINNVPKLTNAKDADKGEIPFIGSLVYGGKHRCGVVLIDNIHAITAAHCIILRAAYDQRLVPEELTVIFGTNVRHKPSRNDPDAVIKEVESWVVHPAYRREEFNKFGPFAGNDLAIVTLSDPVKFSSTVWPICVGTSSDGLGHLNSNLIMLAGFGGDGIRYKNVLQVSNNLTLLTEDECFTELKEKSQREFKDSQICTLPSDSLLGE